MFRRLLGRLAGFIGGGGSIVPPVSEAIITEDGLFQITTETDVPILTEGV